MEFAPYLLCSHHSQAATSKKTSKQRVSHVLDSIGWWLSVCNAWGKGKIKTNGSVPVVVMCVEQRAHSFMMNGWMDRCGGGRGGGGNGVVYGVEPSLLFPMECSLRDRVFLCMSVLLAKRRNLSGRSLIVGLCLFSFHVPVWVLQQETRC